MNMVLEKNEYIEFLKVKLGDVYTNMKNKRNNLEDLINKNPSMYKDKHNDIVRIMENHAELFACILRLPDIDCPKSHYKEIRSEPNGLILIRYMNYLIEVFSVIHNELLKMDMNYPDEVLINSIKFDIKDMKLDSWELNSLKHFEKLLDDIDSLNFEDLFKNLDNIPKN